MSAIDREYYARRIREERCRQRNAVSPAVAQVHAELAERYERLIRNEAVVSER